MTVKLLYFECHPLGESMSKRKMTKLEKRLNKTQRDGLEIKRIIEELRTDTCTEERAKEIYIHYNSKYERDAKWGAILDVVLSEFGSVDFDLVLDGEL